jgi:hypothetical protein
MIPEQHRAGVGERRNPPPRRNDRVPPDDPRSGYPRSPPKDPQKERINPDDPGPLS